MHISISLEPECNLPWKANYEGFSIPGFTPYSALVKRQRIQGHQTLTYEHLIAGISSDLPRASLTELPKIVFSDNIAEQLRTRTRTLLSEKISLTSIAKDVNTLPYLA